MISVSVTFNGKKEKVSVEKDTQAGEVLEKVGINKETVLVRRGDEIIPDNETLRDGDVLEVLRIVSGG